MRRVTPATSRRGRDIALRLAFVSPVVSLVVAFVAVGSTIPLFNIYRAEEGFTNAGISLAVVAYSAATLSALVVLGRMSDHVGRRPTAIASIGLLVLGCPLLLNVQDIGTLADRARIFAGVYLLSYSGATIPSLISAQLAKVFSLPHIALGYAGLAFLATLVTAAAHNPYNDTTSNSQHGELSRGGR
jgi:MFS family permease